MDRTPVVAAHPNGHFYSPVVDPAELLPQQSRLWPESPQLLGVDFNDASHLAILRNEFPRFMADFDYPAQAPAEDSALDRYYIDNSQFGWLDARALFVLLRAWRPRRVIEVGSGYSSLLMADVNQRFLGGEVDITCIEPYPRPFLRNRLPGIARVIEHKVQDLPLDRFAELDAGDILFIDSSHVAKTGSDCNHLYFEVLPRLRPGVLVHIHDIFFPHDYPKDWVLGENRSWNEQYLVRALLMYSSAFRVRFGCSYAFHRFPAEVQAALAYPDGRAFAGGSLWIERV
ncbi:MAG: class I SAM-dependent methyltransferase [Lysobacterales bacterium]